MQSLDDALRIKLGQPDIVVSDRKWHNLDAGSEAVELESSRTMQITRAPPTLVFMLNRCLHALDHM